MLTARSQRTADAPGRSQSRRVSCQKWRRLNRCAVRRSSAQFRGDARVKSDTEITDADLASANLVLWGDPQSNRLLSRIVGRLPVRWDAKEIRLGEKTFPAGNHSPILIFSNPLNPKRYVVVNSGFTFRGFGSNAAQTPKLPDYAIVNLDTPPSEKGPGEVVAAGFFDETWRFSSK